MAMTALERIQLSEQPNFISRVGSVVIEVAREIQLEASPLDRRLDLSFQALRGSELGRTFARAIAGYSHPLTEGGTRAEVTYNSTDGHLKEAVAEVWDYIAGTNLPTAS